MKLRKQMNWIKCSERMPEPDSIVLVFTRYNSCIVAAYDHEKNYWLNSETGEKILKIVEWWQQLPEAPK
jgi:hypothetical protein